MGSAHPTADQGFWRSARANFSLCQCQSSSEDFCFEPWTSSPGLSGQSQGSPLNLAPPLQD
ncbi:MAG: hypothetical protein DCF17_03865 [Shackletoniella antarctica]|uniref:Uncharacterized protein n=1 Tax=Shackletoniella antarctica TaxID=268115 RepID=A0A2W4WII8_9CYAN|nr:MAG: hypothetical protein DCF17_03865 [Shackletoniella antarctica]